MKQIADEQGTDDLIVVLGLNEPDQLRVMATTFRDGDPSYAGPLAGVALGIPSYHIVELEDEVPPDVWREQMAMEVLTIGDELVGQLTAVMSEVRGDA